MNNPSTRDARLDAIRETFDAVIRLADVSIDPEQVEAIARKLGVPVRELNVLAYGTAIAEELEREAV